MVDAATVPARPIAGPGDHCAGPISGKFTITWHSRAMTASPDMRAKRSCRVGATEWCALEINGAKYLRHISDRRVYRGTANAP